MNRYAIRICQDNQITQKHLETESGIILFNTFNIPPHVIYFSKGQVLQVTTRKKKGINLESIKRIKIPLIALILEIDNIDSITNSIRMEISDTGQMTQEKTCFHPIKKAFETRFCESFDFVYNLIEFLYKENYVKALHHMGVNLRDDQQKVLFLKKYNWEDIKTSLKI